MESAKDKKLIVSVSNTEAQLLSGEPNVLGLSTDQDTLVFNNKVIGSGSGVRYKTKQISTSGWYRFAKHKRSASSNVSCIFGIDRGYGNIKDEHYVFVSTVGYQSTTNSHKGEIVQLSGYYREDPNAQCITKIRTSQLQNGPFYLEFYIDARANESYYVWIVGNWELQDLELITDEDSTTSYQTEFSVINGASFLTKEDSLNFLTKEDITKTFTTECVLFKNNAEMICMSNTNIQQIPTSILNGTMYLQEGVNVCSTAIPLKSGVSLNNYPIKLLLNGEWKDVTITINSNSGTSPLSWQLKENQTDITSSKYTLAGQITANFIEN